MAVGSGANQLGYSAGGGEGRMTGVLGTTVVLIDGDSTGPTYEVHRHFNPVPEYQRQHNETYQIPELFKAFIRKTLWN